MKVKDIFKGLKEVNKVLDFFGKKHIKIYVEFNDEFCESFETYKEFKQYIKTYYIHEYVEKLLNEEEHSRGDNYIHFMFHSLGELCEVRFTLDEGE